MSGVKPIAVVTGGNRGLGLETSRQLALKGIQVIVGCRDENKGKSAIENFKNEGLNVMYHQLDVSSTASIDKFTQFIRNEFGRLDILVNNAGIFLDARSKTETSIFNTKLSTVQETFATNVIGPLLISQALIPLMKINNYGRVVNVSSGLGQLSEMEGGYAAYRTSKTSLNALTRIFASELQGTNILVNSVCPGWVKTDMGGPNAMRSIAEGVETIVWLATLPNGGPTGGFFRDRQPIDW